MVRQVKGENSNSVSKFLPLLIFRQNFKQDNNQIKIYKCFENKHIYIFIKFVKIAIRNRRVSTTNMSLCFLPFSTII